MTEHNFQVHLRGIIDLLSNHLYSGPQVFVRELLQNAVDAIRGRQAIEPGVPGEITIEVMAGPTPTVMFADNGIGLTEPEIHQFVATIGASSKRDELGARRGDFLGQFGIGLLSAFLVADEITLITRSARDGGAPIEWRGRQDGSYTVKALDGDLVPGTRVYLRGRAGSSSLLAPEELRRIAADYGGLLPATIRFRAGSSATVLNAEPPPWRRRHATRRAEDEAYREFGRTAFGTDFFDWIPLHAKSGKVEGVAFVLSHSSTPAMRSSHRVYLKDMLLGETVEKLLPPWAFFVRCVVNAGDLRPTASREGFYDDEALDEAREELGACLRSYLVRLSEDDPDRLQRLIGLHNLSMKALAVEDDEFFEILVDWLPFETSVGTMTFREIRERDATVRYAPSVDQFRQLAQVAAAEGICIVNAGYAYDRDLLEKHEALRGAQVERVDPAEFVQRFEDLDLDERESTHGFLEAAEAALAPYGASAELRKFSPADIPALYTIDPDAVFRRSVEQAKDVADQLFSSILDNVAGETRLPGRSLVTFNFRNALVQRVARLSDRPLQRLAVEMLYVQALLLGHHPLRSNEMAMLNAGMIRLIERALSP